MSRDASYQLLSCLGRGGFGEVYLTIARRDGGLERKRALKLLRGDLERLDEAVKRLRDEGRLLALLEHPAIVQVEDIVRIQGRVGLVMEYVEGTDLRQLLRAGVTVPPTVTLEIVATVADAVASAVDLPSPATGRPLRLVHRDIKPGNIMISRHGRVKLLDFGVARSHEVDRDTQTKVGEIPMTPGFGAPEVLLHLIQEPPADVYALGVVFFQAVVGETLFKDLKLTQQVALVVDPRRYHDWLAGRLERVPHAGIRDLIGDMVAWSPAERPTAAEVRERAETLQSQLTGPNLARWIRGVDLPPPPTILDVPLVGQTVVEEAGPGELAREISSPPGPARQVGNAAGASPVAPRQPALPSPASRPLAAPPPAASRPPAAPPASPVARAAPAPSAPARSGPALGGLGPGYSVMIEELPSVVPGPPVSLRPGATLVANDTATSEIEVDTLRPVAIAPIDGDPAPTPRSWLGLLAVLAGGALLLLVIVLAGSVFAALWWLAAPGGL